MIHFFQQHQKQIVLLLLLSALIPYIYISFYSNPVADDFIFAYKGKSGSFFQSWVHEYQSWSGRFTANGLVLLNPVAFDSFIGYKFVPILIIGLLLLSFFFFINVITSPVLKPSSVLVIALLVTLLFIHQMPIISEGIYWYTGAVTYQLGIVFSLLYLGSLIMFFQKKFLLKSKVFHAGVLSLILFFTIGFNEILMIVLLLFSMLVLNIVWRNKIDNKHIVIFLFIASCIFSSIVYFAPGNDIREAYFPNNHQFIYSAAFSLAQTARFFFYWVSSIPLLLLSFLYYYLNLELIKKDNLFSKSFFLTPSKSLFLLFFVIFIGSFPAYWSTGILGQHRTMNISFFLFILMWFVNLTVFFNFKQIRIKKISPKWTVIIFILIWSSLVFTKNGYQAINDILTGKAHDFNELMTERYSKICNEKGVIYFRTVNNPPGTLFVLDITNDPDHWINKAYNMFFEKENKITVREGN